MPSLYQEFDTKVLAATVISALKLAAMFIERKDKDYAAARSHADEGLAAAALYDRCREEGLDEPFESADRIVRERADDLRYTYAHIDASAFEPR